MQSVSTGSVLGGGMAVESKGSIFAQALDRAVLTTYLLGALVPPFALGIVVQWNVAFRLGDLSLTALLVSVCLLSTTCFVALWLIARKWSERMRARNEELAQALEQKERLADYDTLTGLSNRRLYLDRLEQALDRRSAAPFEVEALRVLPRRK